MQIENKVQYSRVLLGYLEVFKGYDFLQICAELLIVEMLTKQFFCQSTTFLNSMGGLIPPPLGRSRNSGSLVELGLITSTVVSKVPCIRFEVEHMSNN